MQTPLNQLMNPTDEQRHEMLRTSLENAGRPEDYEYILNSLSPPPDITRYGLEGDLKGAKIGIIGGGLAGMCAAFELRKLGADLTILEASQNRLGGRVFTYYFDPEGKYYGELGAMRIPISHETTWYYINQLGLNTLSLTSPVRNNFLYVHNTRLRTQDSVEKYLYPLYDLTPQERNTPWTELSNYAFNFNYLKLPPNIRAELINVLPYYSPQILPLMNMSLRQNFEDLGLSQGAINLISGVEPFNGSLLHISYDEIAQEEYSMDYRNTYRIEGGNVNLPYAFYQSLTSSRPPQYCYDNIPQHLLGTVHFKFGHYVTGIYQSDYRNKVVLKYKDTVDEKDGADIFDYVICTIPLSSLRTLEIKPYFSNMKMQAINEYHYINAHKTIYFCNRRFWEKNTDYGNIIGGISFTDLPITSIIYPSDHNQCLPAGTCSPNEPGVLVSAYALEQNADRIGGLSEELQYDLIRQNVEEVHGLPRGYLNTVVERSVSATWNNETYALGALAFTSPGQKPLFSYELTKPEYNNRVYFAGEHVSAKHGWIQGALYTGKAVANQLASNHQGLRTHA